MQLRPQLRDAVWHYASGQQAFEGVHQTALPALSMVSASAPGGLVHSVARPLICLVLQGTKQVTFQARTLTFQPGDSLLITADVPTVSQVTAAAPDQPYLSLVLELDPQVIADLLLAYPAQFAQTHDKIPAKTGSVCNQQTDNEVADCALRLLRLLERPEAVAVLHSALVRELHYWLLCGQHGAALRQLGWPDGHYPKVARAIRLLRERYQQKLSNEQLAATAGMSSSAFYQHFRAVTSLSPLQFQKQLRLIEARRLMSAAGHNASSAAFAVGYESVSQFNREYSRLFGLPPATDIGLARQQQMPVKV